MLKDEIDVSKFTKRESSGDSLFESFLEDVNAKLVRKFESKCVNEFTCGFTLVV